MQRLIDDLLDLSRIESRAWAPAPEPVELTPVAQDVWRAVGSQARFEADVPADAGAVRADPEALRQIFTNILENAARYTPPEGRVTVRAARTDGMVRVEVTDTGSGIPGEHLPRIFERFYRVDPHRSREMGGTGLGLAIVKHLVEAHGGRVEAHSRLGAGTTIRFFLPVALPPG
jgi:signal transduction histidine kinase